MLNLLIVLGCIAFTLVYLSKTLILTSCIMPVKDKTKIALQTTALALDIAAIVFIYFCIAFEFIQ